jgi:hypothetical protein
MKEGDVDGREGMGEKEGDQTRTKNKLNLFFFHI